MLDTEHVAKAPLESLIQSTAWGDTPYPRISMGCQTRGGAEAVEPELFVDEADGGDFVVRTTHRVEAVGDERSRITYRMEITGRPPRPWARRSVPRSAATSRRCSQRWPHAPKVAPEVASARETRRSLLD
jgi:hypothetical protein